MIRLRKNFGKEIGSKFVNLDLASALAMMKDIKHVQVIDLVGSQLRKQFSLLQS